YSVDTIASMLLLLFFFSTIPPPPRSPPLSLHDALPILSVSSISSVTNQASASTFNLNPLSGGTAILVSWLVIFGILHPGTAGLRDRKSTRLNSSHQIISYAVFCLKKKKTQIYKPHNTHQ